MTNRDFDEWLSKFRPSISNYDYYIDFEKVVKNVEEIIDGFTFVWFTDGIGWKNAKGILHQCFMA